MIEIEVQNETNQTQHRLRFAAVPRIGEGIRLMGPDGYWASYDVLDLWYQKAEFGDVWVPYLHVRMTAGEKPAETNVTELPEVPLMDEGVNEFSLSGLGKKPVTLNAVGNGESASFKA